LHRVADGRLAGVCDFASERSRSGIYAAPTSMHAILDANGIDLNPKTTPVPSPEPGAGRKPQPVPRPAPIAEVIPEPDPPNARAALPPGGPDGWHVILGVIASVCAGGGLLVLLRPPGSVGAIYRGVVQSMPQHLQPSASHTMPGTDDIMAVIRTKVGELGELQAAYDRAVASQANAQDQAKRVLDMLRPPAATPTNAPAAVAQPGP